MHSAPPVLVPVGRFVWGTRIWALLALLTGLVGIGWLWQRGAGPSLALWLIAAWLVLLGLSAARLKQEAWPPGQLRWDGQQWWFQAANVVDGVSLPVRLQLVWDGGAALCVRLQSQDDGWMRDVKGFVCLRAADLPAQWHGVRCAVHGGDIL